MDANMMEHMMNPPDVQGDLSTNPFAASMAALNEETNNDLNQTVSEKLEAANYEVTSISIDGKAYDSQNEVVTSVSNNNQSELKGTIDNKQESTNNVSKKEADTNSDTVKDTKSSKNEFAKEESSFTTGVWHPMKCYTHSILKLHDTRLYIHWSFIALSLIYFVFSMAWPENWIEGIHLWIGFRLISPIFYFINLVFLSLIAIWITKAKLKCNHYYFVLFCFGVFNRLRTDIKQFKQRMFYYSIIPILHALLTFTWWILAAVACGGSESCSTLIWDIEELDKDYLSKLLLYQRNLNVLCLLMAALPMPSTFGGLIYASLLQYKRGWSVTGACIFLVFCSIVSLVILTFAWIVNFSRIELLLVVIWSTWQLLEFIFKGKESSGMKAMVLTSVVTHAIQTQQQQSQQQETQGNVSQTTTNNQQKEHKPLTENSTSEIQLDME